MPELQVGASVGITMNLGDYEFIKPYVNAHFRFTPEEVANLTEDQLRRYWQRLWDEQINPQVEMLIASMSSKAITAKTPAKRETPVAAPSSSPPPEGAYS